MSTRNVSIKNMTIKPSRPQNPITGVLALLFVFAFVGVIGSCVITIAIWPGQLKLLAPVFCSDEQSDAFVVADTYSPRPGETVTNFSLYCMGERGDSTDQGFLFPFLLISVVNGIAIFAIVLVLGALSLLRKRARAPGAGVDSTVPEEAAPPGTPAPPPSGSTAGPFVD
jgi:hypothetical protein